MSWTQPVCERCWIDRESQWEPADPAEPDNGLERLVSIRRPVRVADDTPIEVCCLCGLPTIVGLLIRIDPTTVPHPRQEPADA